MKTVLLEPTHNATRCVGVACAVRGEGIFIRQRGEPGRYGHIILSVEPSPEEGLSIEWAVPSSDIANDRLEAVARGVRDTFGPDGKFCGWSFTRTRVRVIDGSDELSFRIAALQAFTNAISAVTLHDTPFPSL